jgi:DNA anti-recombination protein RmuC
MTKKSPRQTTHAPQDGSRAGADAQTSKHLEQVRAILFGEQFTLFEGRLERLEQRLIEEQAAFRDATHGRLDALAAEMEKHVNALRRTLGDGEAKHAEALAQLAGELDRSVTGMEQQLAQVRADADRLAVEHRAQTAERIDALAAQLGDQSNALSALVEQKLEELRTLTADRESLAALFEEMASRLKRSPSG